MDIIEILVLSTVQGLTEFLPISSTGHLVILATLFDGVSEDLHFTLAVHAGSLVAVIWYFRQDLWQLIRGSIRACAGRIFTNELNLVSKLVVATIPILLVGYFVAEYVELTLYNVPVIATATIGFGLLLGLADFRRKTESHASNPVESRSVSVLSVNWRQSIGIGIAQVFAIIPGTSRSGVAITFGLFLGLSRTTAARFAMLMAIPVIALSFVYSLYVESQSVQVIDWRATTVGFVVAAVTALCCIKVFLRFVERIGMMPFVIYRVILGILILGLL